MRKINIFLSILLTIQIGLIAFQFRPGRDDAGPAIDLLPDITAEDVTGLTVEEPEDKEINLVKNKEGRWQVAVTEGQLYPADQEKTGNIVRRLTTLQSRRLVTRTRASHPRLKVGDRIYARKITINTAKGKTGVLFLGTPAGGRTLHARSQGSEKAYLVSGISSWELATDPGSWWQQDYLDINESEINKLALNNKKGSFTLLKNKHWQLAGDGNSTGLAEEKITGFLNRLDNLKIKTYLPGRDKVYNLDAPEAVVRLGRAEGELILKVAPLDNEENTYVVKSSRSPYYVTMRSYALKPLLDKEVSDFRNP